MMKNRQKAHFSKKYQVILTSKAINTQNMTFQMKLFSGSSKSTQKSKRTN